MPVMEREHDHEGDSDGGDESKGDEAVEEGQVGTGLLRRDLFSFGADGITHT